MMRNSTVSMNRLMSKMFDSDLWMTFTYQTSMMISQLPSSRVITTTYSRSTLSFDYSIIALLPIILVGILITFIFCVYRYRQWKRNQKQILELTEFYEIIESSPCLNIPKSYILQHKSNDCESITRAMCPPPNKSLFFQPIPPKTKSSPYTNNGVLKAGNANEVIFHFSQFPPQSSNKSFVNHV